MSDASVESAVSSVDIIIVNWNGADLIRQCVESVLAVASEVDLQRIVVVDNASTDGSANALEHLAARESDPTSNLQPPTSLQIIRNPENRGFAAACNQGATGSSADYLLFLNPDTRLKSGALRVPASFLDETKNADVGIVGIQLVDEHDRVLRTCARLPTPGRAVAQTAALDRLFPRLGHFDLEWDHQDTREVDQVMGAFFFTRRSLFETLGGFDERFFVYMEEVDFSLRAQQAGYKTYYLAGAQAYHRGAGTTDQVKDRRLFYMLRSRILYFYKHFSKLQAGAYMTSVLTLEFAARVVRSLAAGSAPAETLSGYRLLWGDIPLILRADEGIVDSGIAKPRA